MPVDLSDYVEVSERIRVFREKHPEGSLQSEVILWPGNVVDFIAVKAFAYRSPEDNTPGIGHAWEPVPGATPYTRNSELQNAETAAWGRAIVAVLAADTKRGIASADEVKNRSSGGTENEGRSSEGLSRPSESSGGGRTDVLGEGTEVHSPPDSPPAGTDPPSTAGDGRGTGEAAGSPSPHLETTGKMATDGHRHRWRDRVCQDCGLAWGQG